MRICKDPAPRLRFAKRKRRASFSVELLLLAPLLLGFFMAMIQFSMLLTAQQQLALASQQGARTAAAGGTDEEVRQAVQRFLGEGTLSCCKVELELTNASGQPIAAGEPVVVTLSIGAADAVPDLLRFVGFSISGDTLVARTVMRKE
jgi:Flp pilus assembly protein TadG